MGAKTNVVIGAMAAGGLLLGGGSVAYQVVMNQKAHEVEGTSSTVDLSNVAGYAPLDSDKALELGHALTGGNTMIVWHTGKMLGATRHDYNGTWSQLTGAVVYDPSKQTLKALDVRVLLEGFIGYADEFPPAPSGLTNTVLGKGIPPTEPWWDYTAHPEATLTATEFYNRVDLPEAGEYANAPEGWTHLIRGTFQLNGVSNEVEIPATVEFIGEELVLTVGFTVSREAYNVNGGSVPGSVVDDVVNIRATIESSAKEDIVVATLSRYGETIAAQEQQIARLEGQADQLRALLDRVDGIETQLASGATGGNTPAVDVSALPARFTDTVTYPNKQPIPFDMVLVPGDAAAGIAPFYMSTHEVTWDMFYDWSYRTDIDANTAAELENQDLRPSTLYGDSDQLKIGLGDRPAISMSWRTAQAFCKWLSEETGRSYRLPTEAEWRLAVELGGGIPSDPASMLSQATFGDNADTQASDPNDPFADPFADASDALKLTSPVGSHPANALGIYDLLGNAAEWVADSGNGRYVVGGHFMLPLDAFTAEWKSVEDQNIWNETYPQKPNSRFWYRDHYYQGIRLVCDPVNLPE